MEDRKITNFLQEQSMAQEEMKQVRKYKINSKESESSESSLVQARMRVEKQYFKNLSEGRRLRKNSEEIGVLLQHFNRNPIWDYPTKIAIAEQLGMTFGQISKWNWDHRKKLGMCTTRTKAKKPSM